MKDDEIKNEDSTKEINLNDLYDGRINSTVIMDPITKDEVLIKEKKRNVFIYFIIILIILILASYFVYFNTDIIKKTPKVTPNVTTTIKKTKVSSEDTINGNLNCSYSSSNDEEEITSSIKFEILDSNVSNANFLLSVMSKNDTLSSNAKSMLDTYEKLYINNVSVIGNDSLFEKNEKNFSLSLKFDYKLLDFENVVIDNENIKLLLKPTKDDSYYSLSDNYVNLGYSCTLTRSNNNE